MKILTIGYGNLVPDAFFAKLNALEPDLIIDVRADPWHAWSGCYTADSLMRRFPNYVPIPALGNFSRTLPPQLIDEEIGFRQVLMLISPEWRALPKTVKFPPITTVVLLCSELDENRCHRRYVKEKLVQILEDHGIAVETAYL